tara:strand:+ start:907 stop:1749 length:843 start_codon:yes stop_codon:yes gene_type:complete
MKVAIIGFGFVGNALLKGIKNDVEIIKIDPKLGTSISDLIAFKPEFVFICAPTPMSDNGEQDLSILETIFDGLKEANLDSTITLKSTVTPENLETLNKKIEFVYNPEFLREKTSESDFINGKLILFGGRKDLTLKVSEFYKTFTLCKQKKHFFTDLLGASLVKYSINSFLATKVIFFNQLKSVFEASGTKLDWGRFIEILSSDMRIGDSHMNVPGHDGRKGFGGACFPKDIAALITFSSKVNVDLSLIEEVIKINNQIRSVYNEPMAREIEQNISFKEEE